MKDIKVTFSDTSRDFSGWLKEKSEKVLRNLCVVISKNKEIIKDDGFSEVFDNALKIFALSNENLNGIYCDKVHKLLSQYDIEGYYFLCDLIYNDKKSKIMKQIFQAERDEEILKLIEENNPFNRTLIAELLNNTEYKNTWISQIADDIELVHNGDKDWQWVYEKHCNDRNTFELQFNDKYIQEIYEYFQSDAFENADL